MSEPGLDFRMVTEDWEFIQYFTEREMQCPCCGRAQMHLEFVEWLDSVRADLGEPMIVTSGFRCEDRNKQIGGAAHSQHRYGRAVDIARRGDEFRLLKLLFEGATGIGVYPGHFHVDWRPVGADGGWAFWTGDEA